LDQARDHVGRPAWRIWHDDLDIVCGPVLGMSRPWVTSTPRRRQRLESMRIDILPEKLRLCSNDGLE
jgi:hypothetical protein